MVQSPQNDNSTFYNQCLQVNRESGEISILCENGNWKTLISPENPPQVDGCIVSREPIDLEVGGAFHGWLEGHFNQPFPAETGFEISFDTSNGNLDVKYKTPTSGQGSGTLHTLGVADRKALATHYNAQPVYDFSFSCDEKLNPILYCSAQKSQTSRIYGYDSQQSQISDTNIILKLTPPPALSISDFDGSFGNLLGEQLERMGIDVSKPVYLIVNESGEMHYAQKDADTGEIKQMGEYRIATMDSDSVQKLRVELPKGKAVSTETQKPEYSFSLGNTFTIRCTESKSGTTETYIYNPSHSFILGGETYVRIEPRGNYVENNLKAKRTLGSAALEIANNPNLDPNENIYIPDIRAGAQLTDIGFDITKPVFLKINTEREVFAAQINPDTLEITSGEEPIAKATHALASFVTASAKRPETIIGDGTKLKRLSYCTTQVAIAAWKNTPLTFKPRKVFDEAGKQFDEALQLIEAQDPFCKPAQEEGRNNLSILVTTNGLWKTFLRQHGIQDTPVQEAVTEALPAVSQVNESDFVPNPDGPYVPKEEAVVDMSHKRPLITALVQDVLKGLQGGPDVHPDTLDLEGTDLVPGKNVPLLLPGGKTSNEWTYGEKQPLKQAQILPGR